MLIVIGLYSGLIWLIFFKLKLLPWGRASKIVVGFVGLAIALVVIGLLNTKTPSGRVTVVAHVVEVAPVVGGIVSSVTVTPNIPLKAGAVLFEIDKTPFQADLDVAMADLEIAQITYDRKITAFKVNESTVSEQSVDESRAALAAAQGRKDRALYNFEQTVVTAPSDGVVTSLGVSVGDQAQPLSPIMPFIRTDSLFLAGVFSQNGLDGMPVGTPVRILLERKPGKIFESKVVEIASGTSSGQIPVGADILGAADIGNSGETLVVLAWPDGLDRAIASTGSIGSATAIGPDAGAMGILATVLLYLKMIGTFL